MSTIPIQTLIIDNDTNIGLTSDLINGTYKTLSLTDLSNNVYSRIFDLSSSLEVQSDPSKPRGNRKPKRKRWNNSTTAWNTDNLNYQPTKRLRQGTDRDADQLWTRLNQLDPRKQRSSSTRFGHNAIISTAKQKI